jgi:hypothetical protein
MKCLLNILIAILLMLWTETASVAASIVFTKGEETVDALAGVNLWNRETFSSQNNHSPSSKDSRVVIHIPFHYHKAKGEKHESARWGGANIPWSGTLAEFVYYYPQPLCHHVEWNDTALPFWPQVTDENTRQNIRPFILMAPPGPCSPVIWARRAQLIGAAALMIADNVCQCDDQACISNYTAFDCRPAGKPVLINDGTAGDVTIPVWIVSKPVGQALIDSVMTKNQPALVEYAWGLPRNETENDTGASGAVKTVTFYLWTAAAHDPQLTSINVAQLQSVIKAFEGKLILEPKFRLLDGKHFNCPQFTDVNTSPCDHLCTNGGRYCAVHQKDLSGHAVVRESLRRLCIWKHYDQTAYYSYWAEHSSVCADPHLYASKDCVAQSLHNANMDPKIIDDCMKESGDMDSSDSNALLQGMIEEQQISGVVQLPIIAHSDTLEPLRDGPSAHNLFQTTCFHFYWHAKQTNLNWEDIPSICETCIECPNLMGCLEHGQCDGFDQHDKGGKDGGKNPPKGNGKKSGSPHRRRGWHFFWFLVFLGLAYYAYKYYQQQQGNMYQGRGAGGGLLGSYLQLSGGDD